MVDESIVTELSADWLADVYHVIISRAALLNLLLLGAAWERVIVSKMWVVVSVHDATSRSLNNYGRMHSSAAG